MTQYLWLIPVGLALGAYGTLIGAGAGFLLVPLLLLAYPDEPPEVIASISLAVVFANTASGSVAYAWMKRIDYPSGLLFAAVSVPAAIAGALTTYQLPRRLFDLICGVLMLVIAVLLLRDPQRRQGTARLGRPRWRRRVVEADGTTHEYAYNPILGAVLAVVVGFLSGLLGIGGGVIHVPALVRLLDFPVHVATASSHFILSIAALTGTVTHVVEGAFHHGIRRTIALGIGVLIGAQIGALLSGRVHGPWILRGLTIGLVIIGGRLVLLGLGY